MLAKKILRIGYYLNMIDTNCVDFVKSFHDCETHMNLSHVPSSELSMAFLSLGIDVVSTYVFHMLRTYVMILCNWLILWQNALYLYLGGLRMCLTTSRNHVSRSSVEAFKSVQEIKQECKFIKARQLVDTYSTSPICRGLKISDFNSNFLGIYESVYGPSFLLTLDI